MTKKTEIISALEELANLKSDSNIVEIFRMAIAATIAIPIAEYSLILSTDIKQQHLRQVNICTDIMNDIKNKVMAECLLKQVAE